MILKNKKILILFSIILFLCIGCNDNKSSENVISDDKIKIGFAMDTLKEERWQKDRDIFVAEAEKLNAEVLVLAANGNDSRQLEQVNYLIRKKVDVLVVVPHNKQLSKEIVRRAHNVGVKVIAYDRLIEGDVDYYVSFDNEKVGILQGEYITEKLDIKAGNVVFIGGAKTDNNSILLRKGFMQVMSNYPEINIIYDEYTENWDLQEARKHIERALDNNNDSVKAIACANDAIAGVVCDVISERKLDIPVMGQDAEITACQRIVEEKQSMTVYKDVRVLARKAAEIAVLLANDENINTSQSINNSFKEVDSLLLDPIYVDKKNMAERIIKTGYHKYEDVYRNVLIDEK